MHSQRDTPFPGWRASSNAGVLKRNVGFTLVELLVVIGIIAVLVAMLLPALNKARQSAVTLQCASQMRQFGIAYATYATDNKGLLPTSQEFHPLDTPYASPAGAPEPDADFYVKYLGGSKQRTLSVIYSPAVRLYRCPIGPTDPNPAKPWAIDHKGSYAQHYNSSWPGGRPRLKFFRKSSDTGFLAELLNIPDGSYWDWPHKDLTTRHNRGGNILFVDGHVSRMTVGQFFAHATDLRAGNPF
jgi:prepilin-type processing-associated H-X9-DG protein/prepilin-type N-terminal cleavage/methylation domain-containing protein